MRASGSCESPCRRAVAPTLSVTGKTKSSTYAMLAGKGVVGTDDRTSAVTVDEPVILLLQMCCPRVRSVRAKDPP